MNYYLSTGIISPGISGCTKMMRFYRRVAFGSFLSNSEVHLGELLHVQ